MRKQASGQDTIPQYTGCYGEVHQINIHGVVSVWPNAADRSQDYKEFAPREFLLGALSTYDAMNEKARELYWKQLLRELVAGKFDGWWCDSAESFTAPDWNDETKHPEKEWYERVAGEYKIFLDSVEANLFSLRHAKKSMRTSGFPVLKNG